MNPEFLESMHYCIGILNLTYLLEKLPDDSMSDNELDQLAPWNEKVKIEIERRAKNSNQS